MYDMKRILTILAAIVCLCGCNLEKEDFWTKASYATIDAITGTYSLYSATWSSTLDLSGEGLITDDIIYQLQLYGWTGVQTVKYQEDPDHVCVLNQSLVLTPESPEWMAQVNLYVPYPEYGKGNPDISNDKSGKCNLEMDLYQFHYKVDHRGDIELFYPEERQFSSRGGKFTDISVSFEGEFLHFSANTSLYDWSTSSWQDGRMDLKYRHN